MQETWETWVQSLGWEDPLEKGMAPHSAFLPGKYQGQRSLVGCNPWGCKESDKTVQLSTHKKGLYLISRSLWDNSRKPYGGFLGLAFLWVHCPSSSSQTAQPSLQRASSAEANLHVLTLYHPCKGSSYWCGEGGWGQILGCHPMACRGCCARTLRDALEMRSLFPLP